MCATLSPLDTFGTLLTERKPDAFADIIGNSDNPLLMGTAYFYSTPFKGLFIEVEVCGLPYETAGSCCQFYGMHIHETGDCSDNFTMTGNHYNPSDAPHPEHAGDLPPLLGSHGYAYATHYTCCLSVSDVLGRSLIIHGLPDDFTTQPSGNSGGKIGCGVIKAAK